MTQTTTTHDAHARADELDETEPLDDAGDILTDPSELVDRPRLELSPTQLAAGALAAMTAAIIGARLSLAGTVVGAAVGSLVAGLAGALYSLSLRRTQHHLKTLAMTPAGSRAAVAVAAARTATLRATARRPAVADATGPASRAGVTTEPVTRTPGATRRRRPWKSVMVTAVATFAITVVGVTAIELATGRALSGGTGTTIGQVQQSGGAAPAEEAAAEPEVIAEEPTEVPTEEATTPEPGDTEEPTEGPTADPEPSPEPTPEPTPEPSPEPTPEPTPTPTPTPDPTGQPSP